VFSDGLSVWDISKLCKGPADVAMTLTPVNARNESGHVKPRAFHYFGDFIPKNKI
jgi:hypothetical protein